MINNYIPNFSPIKVDLKQHDHTNFELVVEPLMPGFGYTLGNSLRRVLLSSIPGFAVTRVSINDITHEYQAIEHVVEDAFDIILNLKNLKAKINTDADKVVLKLTKFSSGPVTAADFMKDPAVDILNPDLYICHLNSGGKLSIEVEVSRGVGYLSMEDIDLAANPNPKHILVDALFSPVTNVALEVDKVRVGDKTNFDRLSVKYTTNETVTGQEVAEYALKLIIDLFANIHSSLLANTSSPKVSTMEPSKPLTSRQEAVPPSEEINLPTKIKNILYKNNIRTNSELIARANEIENFNGVAEKTLQVIKDYIKTIT